VTPNQPNCSTLEHGTSVFNRLTKAPEQSEWLEQLITLTKCVEAIAAAGAQCLILTAPTQSAKVVLVACSGRQNHFGTLGRGS